jgi:sRNA-binding carbon storage regulator CsrA
MRIMTMRPGQAISLGCDIPLTLLSTHGQSVKFELNAPPYIEVRPAGADLEIASGTASDLGKESPILLPPAQGGRTAKLAALQCASG